MGSMVLLSDKSLLSMSLGFQLRGGEWSRRGLTFLKRQCCELMVEGKRLPPVIIMSQMAKPVTFSTKLASDLPLYESPGASFDQYLEDKSRVLTAIFADERSTRQLNEEEWRIEMQPVQFLFMSAQPAIDLRLRCKSGGIDYPPGVHLDIAKVLQFQIIRWKLLGLPEILESSEFKIDFDAALYPDRHGMASRIRSQLQMSISFVLPPVLAPVPKDVCREVAEMVLKQILERMKDKVNGRLLADYSEFKREKTKATN